MKPSDVVCHAIEIARAALPAKGERAARRGRRADAAADPRPKPDLSRVIGFLIDQPVAVVYCVSLLAYLGCTKWPEDFDFDKYYFWMGDAFPNLRTGLDHLAHNPRLADHLERGWRLLQENGYDLDELLATGAQA